MAGKHKKTNKKKETKSQTKKAPAKKRLKKADAKSAVKKTTLKKTKTSASKPKTSTSKPKASASKSKTLAAKPKSPSPKVKAKQQAASTFETSEKKTQQKTPYSDEQLKKWKQELMALRQTFSGRLHVIRNETMRESVKEVDSDDIADASADAYEQSLNFGLLEDQERKMLLIEEAIARIENKTFGICIDCGQPIPERRLKAIPYTPYCLICADKPHNR